MKRIQTRSDMETQLGKSQMALGFIRFLAKEEGVSVEQMLSEIQALIHQEQDTVMDDDEDQSFYQTAMLHAQRDMGDDETEYTLKDAKQIL
ncbi:hypothetical protein WDW89_12135 [Deltaproteobacteria bacterium TL4]